MKWEPIETAPKDKLIDIVFQDSNGPVRWCDCYYDRICDQWRTSRPSGNIVCVYARHVTHWMLPPELPQTQRSDEEERSDDERSQGNETVA